MFGKLGLGLVTVTLGFWSASAIAFVDYTSSCQGGSVLRRNCPRSGAGCVFSLNGKPAVARAAYVGLEPYLKVWYKAGLNNVNDEPFIACEMPKGQNEHFELPQQFRK